MRVSLRDAQVVYCYSRANGRQGKRAAGEVMKGITQSQSEIRMAYGIGGGVRGSRGKRAPKGRSTSWW